MTEQQQNRPTGMDTWIRRRKVYIVDKKMQYTYIAMVVAMVMVMIVGIAVSNLFMLWMYKQLLVNKYNLPVPTDWKNDLYLFLLVDSTLVIMLIIAAVFYSVLHSHRIAGPLYRLKQSILRLQTGDYNFLVTLRQKDFLKDMADEMNKFITGLQVKNDELRKVRTRLDELGKRVAASQGGAEHVAELQDLANQVTMLTMIKDPYAPKETPAMGVSPLPNLPPAS